MISLYNSTETNFNNNGLVVLSDCKTAFVEELINDKYEAEIEYPIDARGKWHYIIEGNIIKAEGQLFRIYNTVKTLSGIQAVARHIYYDLMNNFIETCTISDLNANGAINALLSHTQYDHSYIATSDINSTATLTITKKNPIDAIMGSDGVISSYGGELLRDNFSITLYQSRGSDRGVVISYGKNITGIEETLNMDSVCTRLMPVGANGLLLPEKYLDSSIINNYPQPIVRMVDFSSCSTEESLRAVGIDYLSQHDKPLVNYRVNFVELTRTMEYKNYAILETVSLGDTVTVNHSKLNLKIKLRVIRIRKNELTNRIEEIDLGFFKPNIVTKITSQQSQIDDSAAVISDIKNGDLRAEIIKIGTTNELGTSQIDTRGDGLRLQSHAAGNYLKIEDTGGVSFYTTLGGTEHCCGQINPDGTSTFGGGGSVAPAVAIAVAWRAADVGVTITRDGIAEVWSWVKDGTTGKITSMTSDRGRTITVTY